MTFVAKDHFEVKFRRARSAHEGPRVPLKKRSVIDVGT